MIFVDTNYFLRFFINDHSEQHEEVKVLFRRGANEDVKLFTSIIVFFEIYWVTTSFYKKNKEDIVRVLRNTLKMDFIFLDERSILRDAIDVFAKTNFDLEDSYNLVYSHAHKALEFKTFDNALKKRFLIQRKSV